MKKTLVTLITVVALGGTAVHGQGSVRFDNLTSGLITGLGGVGFAGDLFRVDLYWLPGGIGANTTASMIATGNFFAAGADVFGTVGYPGLIEPTSEFGAGFFHAGVVTLPAPATAGTVTMIAVAFANAPSYMAALTTPGAWFGASAPFETTLATGITPPIATMVPSFQVIPEPSSFALAGLGLACLLIFRRRQQK